jgi:hypothetical protein
MPTQIAKLDGWSYLAYRTTNATTSLTNLDTLSLIAEQTNNKINGLGGATVLTNIKATTAASPSVCGETVYRSGDSATDNRSAYYIAGDRPFVTASGLADINAAKGFELHACFYNLAPTDTNDVYAFTFVFNSVTYRLVWKYTTGQLLLRTNSSATQLFTGDPTSSTFATALWTSIRFRAFVSGDRLYVQASGSNTASAFGFVDLGEISGSFTAVGMPYFSVGDGSSRYNNLSLYTISEAEATTYAAAISTNNLAPFQRYAPMIDIVPVFGTDWTGNDDTAFADLTDGDLTTFATTDTLDAPIGYVASDGVATNSIVSGEWYMVIAGGVGVDFSSVGGPASAVLNDVFLATSAGTIGTNSVYLLLTMGDILGRCYSWTPGTLTALPTIGLVRSGGSMAFSVANTDAETTRFKFGTPEDGDNVSAFNYVQADVETTGNPFGETLATSYFDDGTGEFTDGTNTHTFTTSQPVIFTLERKS